MPMIFRVGKGGASQSYAPPNPTAYVQVTWPSILEDSTGGFNALTGMWTAPANGILLTGWQVWDQQNAATSGSPIFVSKLIKNNSIPYDSSTAAIGPSGAPPGSSAQEATVALTTNQGDQFYIGNYCSPNSYGTNIAIDANDAHTWWWGLFFQS